MFLNETIPRYIGEIAGYKAGLFGSNLSAAVSILIASVVLAFFADLIFGKVFMHYACKTRYECDDLVVSAFRKPIFYTFMVFGFFIAAETVYPGNTIVEFIAGIFFTLLGIVWVIALLQINKILFKHVFFHLVKKTDTTMDDELLPLFKNIVSVLIIFFGFLAILRGIWDLNVTPLFASAGLAGLALAFAAQDSISQLFGGVSLYFDQPFKIGDRIEIDGGEIGIVQDIGVRSTRLINMYNNMIVIPNSIIANSRIVNYTSPEPTMMVKIPIGVTYGSDVEKVKKVLCEIARSIDLVMDTPAPYARFENHSDFSLDFALIVWIKYPGEKFIVIDKVNTLINKKFKEEGIEIPFPTRTLIMGK
jgi:small-conductance mechanosensitive channel